MAPAYHALTSWIAEQGHEIAGPPREIYLNDPQRIPPAELLTRLEFPICTDAD
ncbi:MAG: GyrI-like domain-containing protein [Acidimicrobiia bacterium]|nr:GyrI-like domain-containing protein [Acidimicrobiia bacterium]MDX2467710.1 GyrI-like domain-containing protein [Acidimicrobiia bacterium]